MDYISELSFLLTVLLIHLLILPLPSFKRGKILIKKNTLEYSLFGSLISVEHLSIYIMSFLSIILFIIFLPIFSVYYLMASKGTVGLMQSVVVMGVMITILISAYKFYKKKE